MRIPFQWNQQIFLDIFSPMMCYVCASKSTLVFRCIIVRLFPLNYGNESVCRCVQAPTDNELKRRRLLPFSFFFFFHSRIFFGVQRKKRVKTSNECVRRLAMLICVNQAQTMYVIENLQITRCMHLLFLILSSILYIYICEDEKTSLLELRENECNEICWVGRAVDLIRYIHIFFLSLFFLSNANRVSFHLSFFSLLTGDSVSLSSSFQLSKWTNQSPLTSLFFLLARSPRALSFLVSVASFSFAFFLQYTLLCTNPSFRVFFLRCLFFSRCHPPRNKKKTRASANAVDERPKRTREQRN